MFTLGVCCGQARGVKLKQFYSEPQCSPTRGAVLTGRYPHRWGGQSGVAEPGCPTFVNDGEVFLSERLQDVGFYTAYIGKWSATTPLPSGPVLFAPYSWAMRGLGAGI